jgi:hypothetical protein
MTIDNIAIAMDKLRIFPRIFIGTYIYMFYKCVMWYMTLPRTHN